MTEPIKEAPVCPSEYAEQIANLETLLNLDLPDCAKLFVAQNTSEAGTSERLTIMGFDSDGNREIISIENDGNCARSSYTKHDSTWIPGEISACWNENTFRTTPETVSRALDIAKNLK